MLLTVRTRQQRWVSFAHKRSCRLGSASLASQSSYRTATRATRRPPRKRRTSHGERASTSWRWLSAHGWTSTNWKESSATRHTGTPYRCLATSRLDRSCTPSETPSAAVSICLRFSHIPWDVMPSRPKFSTSAWSSSPHAMLASFSRRLSSWPCRQSSKSRHLRYVLLW